MPLEELLAMYGCGREQPPLRPSAAQGTGDASSSSSGAGEDTAAGQEAAVGNGRTGETSNADSEPMQTSRLLRCEFKYNLLWTKDFHFYYLLCFKLFVSALHSVVDSIAFALA